MLEVFWEYQIGFLPTLMRRKNAIHHLQRTSLFGSQDTLIVDHLQEKRRIAVGLKPLVFMNLKTRRAHQPQHITNPFSWHFYLPPHFDQHRWIVKLFFAWTFSLFHFGSLMYPFSCTTILFVSLLYCPSTLSSLEAARDLRRWCLPIVSDLYYQCSFFHLIPLSNRRFPSHCYHFLNSMVVQ